MHAEPPDFAEAIGPLEARVGRHLRGAGRQVCLAAFAESPDGFRRIATDALTRARTNPLGLLIRMATDGEHRAPSPKESNDGPDLSAYVGA